MTHSTATAQKDYQHHTNDNVAVDIYKNIEKTVRRDAPVPEASSADEERSSSDNLPPAKRAKTASLTIPIRLKFTEPEISCIAVF